MYVDAAHTIVVRLQNHLQNTEDSATEVQQHVANTPTHRALPAEVHVHLEPAVRKKTGRLDVRVIQMGRYKRKIHLEIE